MIAKVKAIVEADPDRRYVVPSAPGKRNPKDQKVTDLLYLCHEHARQGVPFGELRPQPAPREPRRNLGDVAERAEGPALGPVGRRQRLADRGCVAEVA